MQNDREYGVDVERELAAQQGLMFLDELPAADDVAQVGFRKFAADCQFGDFSLAPNDPEIYNRLMDAMVEADIQAALLASPEQRTDGRVLVLVDTSDSIAPARMVEILAEIDTLKLVHDAQPMVYIPDVSGSMNSEPVTLRDFQVEAMDAIREHIRNHTFFGMPGIGKSSAHHDVLVVDKDGYYEPRFPRFVKNEEPSDPKSFFRAFEGRRRDGSFKRGKRKGKR